MAEERQVFQSLAEEADELSAIVVDLRAFALADAPVHGAARLDLSLLVAEAADIIGALGDYEASASMRRSNLASQCEVMPSA